ncbi:MAG: shikimate dehydrogenase [Nitrospirales bacterium]|nr:shikimate dehydrogenase [Nitrospirales bacterium]
MDINPNTQLCGLLGNPVAHSLSPAIHNAAFRELNLNFVYLAFPVEDLEGAIQGIRAMGNLRGFSVTIPHKVAILPLLDGVEKTAKNIGSVNTVIKDRGRLIGSNTDASGAIQALRQGDVDLSGKRVVLLGSGGAARAIAFGLCLEQPIEELTVLGIDDTERTTLAHDLRSKTPVKILDESLNPDTLRMRLPQAQLLIHTTPIGMHPNIGETCVPKDLLHPDLTVMDIVYNPLHTQLLKDAKTADCRTIQGVEMFLHQAVGQFELWTGESAPVKVMRHVLTSHFS